MATVFEARPLSKCPAPAAREDETSVSAAIASLETAAKQVYEAADARPEARRRAADLLTLYARRLHAIDLEESWEG